MATKTTEMKKEGIKDLPQDKPVVYKIMNNQGENIYTGVANRNNVQNRIGDHLSGGSDPIQGAAKVQVEQMPSIDDARLKEARIIARTKPKYNRQGK